MSIPIRTYLVAAPERYGSDATLRVMEDAIGAGVDALGLDPEGLTMRGLTALVEKILSMTVNSTARLIVGERVDVALGTGANGVHLGTDSLHPEAARELALRSGREGFLVGVSTHNRAGVARASAGNADFVTFGPVFDSGDEERFGPPHGLEGLTGVCSEGWIPVLAVGGIDPGNAGAALEAGAAGTSCTRAVFEAADPGDAIRRWVEAAGILADSSTGDPTGGPPVDIDTD